MTLSGKGAYKIAERAFLRNFKGENFLAMYAEDISVRAGSAYQYFLDTQGPNIALRARLEYLVEAAVKLLAKHFKEDELEFDYVIDPMWDRGNETAPIVWISCRSEERLTVVYQDDYTHDELFFAEVKDFEGAVEEIVLAAETTIYDHILDLPEETEEKPKGPRARARA
jgi:hypothetical protein